MRLLNRGELEFEIDGRLVIVTGEGHFVGKGVPDFIVFSKEPMRWVGGGRLSGSERTNILRRVSELAEAEGMLVTVAY